MNIIPLIGRWVLAIIHETGSISCFFGRFVLNLLRGPLYLRLLLKQCEAIGFNSIPIVLLTAFFTGGVLALQSFDGFDNKALAATQVGSLVALSMIRELGPVLGSLMVAGRVGAAIAAELGTMKVTEQIDALTTLATNPIKYLVVPRILACILTVPMLVILGNVVGIFGGYTVSVNSLGVNAHTYIESSFRAIEFSDIILSLVKAAVFGALVGTMGCYHGYNTRGGAEGVGRATTIAVVYASVSILIFDYFITAWMF